MDSKTKKSTDSVRCAPVHPSRIYLLFTANYMLTYRTLVILPKHSRGVLGYGRQPAPAGTNGHKPLGQETSFASKPHLERSFTVILCSATQPLLQDTTNLYDKLLRQAFVAALLCSRPLMRHAQWTFPINLLCDATKSAANLCTPSATDLLCNEPLQPVSLATCPQWIYLINLLCDEQLQPSLQPPLRQTSSATNLCDELLQRTSQHLLCTRKDL